MPSMPPTLGKRPRIESQRAYDAERRRVKPWRGFYSTREWKAIRRDQLARQPLCERHLRRGQVVAANTVNHKYPHRGDWDLFISGPFESLCKRCHDSEAQRDDRASSRR